MDDFLKERLVKYDSWLDSGQILFSSKIIPVRESLSALQWVLPSGQVLDILRNARSIAVQNCGCRVHYSRCNNPLEVCFLLNDRSEHAIEKGVARQVSLSEARDILQKADEYGLIHLTLYQPDHEIYALCNCCPCCCHDLQLMKVYNRRDLVVRSEYVAVTDIDSCTSCGKCIERCIFNARTLDDGRMHYNSGLCLGCGLCVTICPEHATAMQPRDQ
jgi:Pyruvate/2-oxoacid:ferredoxin oxidoreductase delta subunit